MLCLTLLTRTGLTERWCRLAPYGDPLWEGSTPPEKFLSSSLTFIRKNIFPLSVGEEIQQTFSYPSAQSSGNYVHI